MAPPRKKLKKEDYGRIEEWRAGGSSQAEAARRLKMAPKTFRAVLCRDDRAARHWEWGAARREQWLIQRLHDPEVKNKLPILFELKCRHGWVDQPQPQQATNKVEVTFQLPAPLDREQYQKVIEVAPRKALKDGRKDAT